MENSLVSIWQSFGVIYEGISEAKDVWNEEKIWRNYFTLFSLEWDGGSSKKEHKEKLLGV